MAEPRHLLIVAHTPTDNTRALTAAVRRGAAHPDVDGVTTRLVAPLAAGETEVLWADAIILGTPANFGYMSGALKDFFDRIYDPCLDKTARLPYALFIRGKTDATGALTSIDKVVGGLNWRRVAEPLLVVGELTTQHVAACEELGMTMAAGLEARIF